MNRLILVMLLGLGCTASCRLPTLPQVVPPAISTRTDAPADERTATFGVPLSVPLAELKTLLREQLALPSAPDWQLVTEAEQSPEIEVRYQADLLEPHIELHGQTLVLKLEVAYFGSLRARVHTPFGWLRLTKNTRWGDPQRRGVIAVEIHTALELSSDYRVHARSSLSAVTFSAPPVDKLCAGGAFKICIPAAVAARPIHAELERRVRARVEEGLREVDSQVLARASLTPHAERIWQRLSKPSAPLAGGERLQLRPRELSLTYPELVGDELRVVLGIVASPVFGDAPLEATPPLPPLQVGRPAVTVVPLRFVESYTALSTGLSDAMRLMQAQRAAQEQGDGPKPAQLPTRIEVLGPAREATRWIIGLAFERGRQARTAYAEAAIVGSGDGVKLEGLVLTSESGTLLDMANVDSAAFLAAASAAVHRPVAALQPRIAELRALIAESFAPLPIDPLPAPAVQVVSVRAAHGGVLLEAELR